MDERRQLLLVVDDGGVRWVPNTSSGTDEHYTYRDRRYLAETPHGRWEIYRLHGYSNVPPMRRLPRLRPGNPGRYRLDLRGRRHPVGTPVWVC